VAHKQAPYFSQEVIDALRHTPEFEQWNRDFEELKSAIGKRVSPRDIRPLVKAGVKEDRLLTYLALVVVGPDGLSSAFMARRQLLAKLAAQLMNVTEQAILIVNDPLCDGRWWWALEAGLHWDLVPKAGVIEVAALKQMRALARLIKERGDAFGKHSRPLKKIVRNRGLGDLIAYVRICTKENFDAEIACLLEASYRAADPKKYKLVCSLAKRERYFTADQIKKFRQRHFAAGQNGKLKSQGTIETISTDRQFKQTKTFGQRIAEVG
jgi:hypothetical protein